MMRATSRSNLVGKGKRMFINSRLNLFLLILLLCSPQVSARKNNSASQTRDGKIHLDVVVAAKSGSPVSGLQQQEFEVFDNRTPRTIRSFRAVDGRQERIEVLVVVDAVNTDQQNVAYEREQIEKFFRSDGGHL